MNDPRLLSDRFPRTSAYNPDWLLATCGGAANSLWLAEWLAPTLNLQPGMRVLDLGCGLAASSIFLHREFGVQVWATDLWISASDNLRRIRDAGAQDGVFPIHAEARALPFANEFFDAIVSIDSYMYYGTDDLYLSYLARLVKPGGPIGIANAALLHEFDGPIPEHLREWWTPDLWCLHSAAWWRRHWEKPGILDVQLADSMPDGWLLWLEWLKLIAPENKVEIHALETDAGRCLGYARAVGRRRHDAPLSDPVVSLPAPCVPKPLLRS